MSIIPFTSAARFAPQAAGGGPIPALAVAPQAVCRPRFVPAAPIGLALTPAEALRQADEHPHWQEVVLDGPGDPLAAMDRTLETLALLTARHPALTLAVATHGLGGEAHAATLATAGVNRVVVLVETLETATVEKLYAWIRPGKKNVPLAKAAPLLLDEQARTVRAMAAAGLAVTIRTTVYPGVNAHQLAALAETMAELGASAMELVPFSPDPHQADGPAAATRLHMEQLAKLTGRFLSTTAHQIPVATCGCDCGPVCGSGTTCGCSAAPPAQDGLPKPSPSRPRVAVASSTGLDVDLHLGQASALLIYGPREDGLTCLLETRKAPEPGTGETRWQQLADTLPDCFALLASSAGHRPREVLSDRGIRILLTEDNIEGTVDLLCGGGKKQSCKKP